MTSNLKDKLSASVRRAKASQQADNTNEPASETLATRKAAGKSTNVKAATTKTAARMSARKSATTTRPAPTAEARSTTLTQAPPAAAPSSANQVKESGTALFPDRVWPD